MINRTGIYRGALRGGALTYSSGMLSEALLGWQLDPRVTLLSELAAKDRKHRRIFQVSDVVSGSLFLISAATLRPRSGGLRSFLSVFGAATIADAFSPLDYPISHDHLRPDSVHKPWNAGLRHRAHYVTTSLAGLATTGICFEHWRRQGAGSGIVRRFAGPAVVLGQVAGVLALLSPKLMPGLVQRAQTLGFSAIALDLARKQ